MPSVHEHVQLFDLFEEQGRRIHLDEARRTRSFVVQKQSDTRAGRWRCQVALKACGRATERKCDDDADARTRRAATAVTVLGARVRDGRRACGERVHDATAHGASPDGRTGPCTSASKAAATEKSATTREARQGTRQGEGTARVRRASARVVEGPHGARSRAEHGHRDDDSRQGGGKGERKGKGEREPATPVLHRQPCTAVRAVWADAGFGTYDALVVALLHARVRLGRQPHAVVRVGGGGGGLAAARGGGVLLVGAATTAGHDRPWSL